MYANDPTEACHIADLKYPGKRDAVSPATVTVVTNMGTMPLEDYCEIKASQYGYDSYQELRAAGFHLDVAALSKSANI